eukprot:jgi/Astpho2/5908/Aster-x1336
MDGEGTQQQAAACLPVPGVGSREALGVQELSMIETKIFKDPEGLKLFQEYASDIADPKACKIHFAEQEQYLRQLEAEGAQPEPSDLGEDMQLVVPVASYVIKTVRKDSGRKVFINVCHSEKMEQPSSSPAQEPDMPRRTQWLIPNAISPPRDGTDRKGQACTVFDLVVHTVTVQIALENRTFRVRLPCLADNVYERGTGGKQGEQQEEGQGLVADTACEQVERREGYRVSRQVVHPKLTFKESPGLGEPRVTSIPQGKPVQAGPGSSSCSRGPSAPHAASAAAAAGSQGSHPGTASSGQGSRPPSDSKAASTAAAAGRRGSNSGMPRASPAAEAGTHLLGKVAGTQGSSRSAEASSSLTSQGSPACPPRQSSWAKGSSWATEGSSTKASPETQKGPAPAQPDAAGNSGNTAASCKGLTGTEVNADAGISRSPSKAKARSSPQPAAADDSGDRIASYRGLIGTEAEPEVHLLHSGQHDLATSWGDANRNLYVDVSRPKELKVRILLPGLKGAAQITLDVEPRSVSAHVAGKYRLDALPLPYEVDTERFRATFNIDKQALQLTLTVVPPSSTSTRHPAQADSTSAAQPERLAAGPGSDGSSRSGGEQSLWPLMLRLLPTHVAMEGLRQEITPSRLLPR